MLVTALAVAGCDGGKDDVETKTIDDAKAVVQARAESVAGQLGGVLTRPSLLDAPCTGRRGESGGDGVYFIQGGYQVALPAAEHVATAARVRDEWKAAGWTITDNRTIGTTAILAATTPDEFKVHLESTVQGSALALLVYSPCYGSPSGGNHAAWQ
ncbi:hypothetical protein Ato02nite_027230 [Paractinoplanes toevensis]|uniref:Lipoprotein n=2 Tax=Paractinoplanes toevensis TaxID=571911 RepID=A0A919T8F3_9ACTN|nr:hypothetical protein Ato02nite_027230 [Actinoplanes toevensis]